MVILAVEITGLPNQKSGHFTDFGQIKHGISGLATAWIDSGYFFEFTDCHQGDEGKSI